MNARIQMGTSLSFVNLAEQGCAIYIDKVSAKQTIERVARTLSIVCCTPAELFIIGIEFVTMFVNF